MKMFESKKCTIEATLGRRLLIIPAQTFDPSRCSGHHGPTLFIYWTASTEHMKKKEEIIVSASTIVPLRGHKNNTTKGKEKAKGDNDSQQQLQLQQLVQFLIRRVILIREIIALTKS